MAGPPKTCRCTHVQVESIEAAAQLPQPKQAPVLSLDAFRRLCSAPPLQVIGHIHLVVCMQALLWVLCL